MTSVAPPDQDSITAAKRPDPPNLHSGPGLPPAPSGKFQAEGTPQRFVGLLQEVDSMEQNSSADERL